MTAAPKDPEDRSFHTDSSSKYFLPNDSSEHARLELQHEFFTVILQNKVLRAPVSKVTQILDVGCGTGCMTHWLAEAFPAATVTGLDLSPIPRIRNQPANVRYLQGNILQNSPRDWISEDGDRPVLEERGVFDLVFSRLLLAGISDWEGYIAKQFSLLKPGGWAEFQEPDMVVYNAQDQIVDAWDVFKTDAGLNGFDNQCGELMKGRVRGAGFEMVDTEVFTMPFGGTGQLTQELRDFGERAMRNTLDIAEVAARRNEVAGESGEAEKVMLRLRTVMAEADGWYMKYYVTYGRKPE